MKHSTFFEGYFSLYLPTTVRGLILFVFSLALASFFTFWSSLPVQAATGTNNQINYQGKLLDSTGAVVANGTYSIKFSIYDSATSGNRLWTATGTTATPIALSVTVQSGLFTILLGDNSTGTSQQNALDNTINWNSDTLYLGITIGSDSEMTPRKRLSSAPYAFNAERLQGMYASSSVFATSSLFVINQTSNTAATGTRSALEIRSSGTSTPYDFLLRGVNDQSDAVFTVNRLGSVTTTGNFALGDGTSDLITVNGRFNADLVPATDLTYSFGTASLRWNAILGNVTSSAVTTTSAYVSGTASTTLLFANSATFGTSTIAGKGVCLSDGSFCSGGAGSDTLATVTDRGSSATATLQLYGGFLASSSTVTSTFTVVGGTSLQGTTFTSATGTSFSLSGRVNSDLLPQTDLAYSLGSTALRWNGAFGHVTATTVTTTNLFASNLSVNNFSSLNVTTTNLSVSGTLSLAYASGTDPGLVATVEVPADETVVDLIVSDRHVYALGTGVLRVWDVTNPAAPTTTATSSVFGGESMALEGRYLYVNSGASGFQIFDITSADRPFVVGSSTESFAGERTFVRGGYMYIGNNIYDVHDPRSIDLVATTINAVTFFTDGFLQGKVYFQVRSSGSSELQMWDVSDPYRPVVIASAALAYTPDQITVQGGYAYIGVSGSDEIHVYDIGNLENVYEVASFTGNGEMQAAGRYLYTSGMQIFDIVNPLSPTLVKVIPLIESPIAVSGKYAYAASSGVTDYFHVVDLGGIETPALSSAIAEIGYLQVRTDGRVGGNLAITGALTVGPGGLFVDGPFMVNASNTTSSVAGSIAFEQNATVGTSTYTDQLHSLFAMSGDDLFVAGNIGSVSSVYTNGAFIAGTGTTMFGDGFIHRTNGNMSLSSSGGYYLPASDLGTRLGSASLRFHGYFGDTTSTNVTTTAFSFTAAKGTTSTITTINATNLFWANATGTAVTSTYGHFSNTVSTTQLFANSAVFGTSTVAGKGVCLSDGTFCAAAAAGADLNWTFTAANGGFVYNATQTTDIVFGNTATTTGAAAYFDLTGGTVGTSTLYLGHATNVNVVLGGTSTTNTGLNSLFVMNGNDMFVHGNIGAASSVYTNGAFVAGTGSTFYGEGFVNRTNGSLTMSATGGITFNSGVTSTGWLGFGTSTSNMLQLNQNSISFISANGTLNFSASTTKFSSTFDQGFTTDTYWTVAATMTVPFSATSNFPLSDTQIVDDVMYFLSYDSFGSGSASASIAIIDVSSPKQPSLIKNIVPHLDVPAATATAFLVDGNYMYVKATNNWLIIYDIQNRLSPTVVTATRCSCTTQGTGEGPFLFLISGYLYISSSNALWVYDVLDPTNPRRTFLASGSFAGMHRKGKYLYISDTSGVPGLRVYDTSNPSTPILVSSLAGGQSNVSYISRGRYLHSLNYNTGGISASYIKTIDISNPASPTLVSTTTLFSSSLIQPRQIGRYLIYTTLISTTLSSRIVDIDQGFATTSLPAYGPSVGVNTTVAFWDIHGRYGFIGLASSTLGVVDMQGAELPTANIGHARVGTLRVDQNAEIEEATINNLKVGFGGLFSYAGISALGGFTAVSGSTSTIYSSSFIQASSTGFTIMSVSGTRFQGAVSQQLDGFFSASPTQTAPPGALASFFNPTGIAIEGDRLYLLEHVSDGALFAEFDISVRQRPAFVATSTVSGAASVFFRGQGIAVRNHFMYVPDDGKVQVYNVATATTPTLLGEAADSGGLIDLYSRVFIKGNTLFACMNQSENTLLAFDIANARKPIYLNAVTQPFAQTGGGSGTCDEEEGYLYGITGASGTLALFDVRAPAELTLAYTTTVFPPAAFGSSAVKVRGNYAYVTHSSNGLQIIDISDKSHFRTVGSHASGNGSIVLVGDYLITDSLHVFDVSDPSNPTLIRTLTGTVGVTDQILYDGYLYKVVNTNKIQVHNFNGLDIYGIRAGVGSFGQLTVNGTGFFNEDVRIVGGLDVGIKGILSSGGISVAVSSTTGTTSFVNYGVDTIGRAWGAYINTLSVGTSTSATGSLHHTMVLTYSSSTRGGLCIDDISTASTCPSQVGYSLVADGPIGASGFDLAERYASTGTVASGDLVSLTPSATATVMRSSGIPYDPKLIGIISSSPGFTLGIHDGEQVALTGRVPTKVSTVNGPIRIGDPLTSSQYPGVAMKATKPGMIVGYALDDADTTSTIEVFVNVGYNAGAVLATDGTISEVRDNLVFAATAIASSTSPAVDSFGLTFRGSAYNTSTSELSAPSFTLLTDVQSAASSVFAFRNASGTNVASLSEQGDLSIAGRLFLSARGTPQDRFYLYLDDSLAPTSSYIATNANGFQANSSYDLAERYYSPDNLEPGDLVMIRPEGQIHVQRTSGEEHVVIGIVSTQPGFVLGAHSTSSYPIALAGRVPTKVSTMNGAIKAGDPVGPSSIPGVAVKATSGGSIVGYALEAYDAPDVGKVEVFLSAQAALAQTEQEAPQPAVLGASTSNDSPGGFATIQSGATRVHVSFESIGAYPKVFVTPATEAGDWWTEDYSDTGFDIVISSVLPRDVMFGWEVRPLMAGSQLFSSDNTYQALDPLTGQIIPTVQEDAEVTGDEGDVPVDETAAEETGSASSTEPTR